MRNKVIFGTKTESKEAPWAVPIAVYRYEGVLHCTATLVSSRHIITARHCFVRDFEHGSFRYVFNGEVINKDNCRGEDYIVPPERSEADIHFATRCRDEETCENINLPTNLITRKPALVKAYSSLSFSFQKNNLGCLTRTVFRKCSNISQSR
ncbi:hypothetical protein L5515_000514 [Caenorhabditis briggsae]|uniref:Peptidase S1 domain-containing protein n=1 Tax=Caenorhabditis briggsae TaxID=6238 RepID=A0AAE9DZY8_CAEBR|nr:hypothetical protein L5515_000514 [Caenorhabditis briggsae]